MWWKISLYIILTLGFTLLLGAFQYTIGLDFKKIVIPQFAPAIGFLFIAVFFKTLRRYLNFKINSLVIRQSLIAFFLPLAMTILIFFLGKMIGLDLKINEDFWVILPSIIGGVFLGALGEEIGWRGFLQPTLAKNNTELRAAMLVGIIWGLWHIMNYGNGLGYMFGFVTVSVLYSIMITWLMRGTEYNLWIPTIFHFSVNISFALLFGLEEVDFHSELMLIYITGFVWLIPVFIAIKSNGSLKAI